MSDKYTVTVSTISAYDSKVITSYTGTLEELAQWGYFGDPTNPAPDPRFNLFNDDLYIIENAVNPITGKIVKGYRWFNDGHGDNPAHPAFEDPQAVKAIDTETSKLENWNSTKSPRGNTLLCILSLWSSLMRMSLSILGTPVKIRSMA